MLQRIRDLIVELSMIVALGFALALAIPQANAAEPGSASCACEGSATMSPL
jgi:hypothetical protein